jgi:methionyl-tRNA formyltransferase
MAVPPLRALLAAGHEVLLVVTNPPRRRGRRGEPTPTAVGAAAVEAGLAVSHDPDDILSVDADLGVVVAFGRIIRPHVLAHLPMVNLHFSLLPRWRGAAPVERALLAGDDRTGVCVMDVEEGLDTGGVHARAEVPIGPSTTAAQLREQLVELGSELLVDTLSRPLGPPEPQAGHGVTYAAKLGPEDLHLDWSRPAEELDRQVRVGGAWTTLDGRRLKVLEARPVEAGAPGDPESAGGPAPGELAGDVVGCGAGALALRRVQPEGRAAMDASAFLNGARLPPGTVLGT